MHHVNLVELADYEISHLEMSGLCTRNSLSITN